MDTWKLKFMQISLTFTLYLDVDYCALGHNCDENATCLNLNTSYTCKCNRGFQGDGIRCTGTFKVNFKNK
jgi:EGF domain